MNPKEGRFSTKEETSMRRLKSIVLTTLTVAMLSATSLAANAQAGPEQAKPLPEGYVPDLAKPDRDTIVKPDLQFIADRLSIINTVMSYSHLFDERKFDEWRKLWTDDIVFETVVPGSGTIRTTGEDIFWEVVANRYGAPTSSKRRHFQSNVHVAEQTATTARVLTYMLIATTPPSGQFQPLTSGTYDGTLRKMPDGTWKISRWYIHVDAVISPIDLTGVWDKVEYAPDPFLRPQAGAVLGPIKGEIAFKNYPLGSPYNGPLYENTPEGGWKWEDTDVILVDFITDAKAAAAFLPEQMTTYPIPEMPGKSLVKLLFADYRKTSIGPYKELVVQIPALHQGKLSLYVPLIYVDSDRAIASGREMGGFPKKLATISMERYGSDWDAYLERDGTRIISLSSRRGSSLVSTPLPADKPVVLPFPYNMTFPLPPPTGQPQDFIPLPLTSLQVIPGIGKTEPTPIVARLIGSDWQLFGTFYQGEGTSLAIRPSGNDCAVAWPWRAHHCTR
jgi:Acetoacetate decarboxylase (ADC)/SnoaL-like domain